MTRAGARRVLVVRLDGAGDVLLAGPAVRAVAARGGDGPPAVTLLCGPAGAAAGRLLPGVADVLTWASPWVVNPAPPIDRAALDRLVDDLAARAFDEAVVLTSFHQSPLPTALVLRLAGVPRIAGASVDYPGTLLDVRLRPGSGPGDDLPDDLPEPERALAIAAAAGYRLPADDPGGLAVVAPPPVDDLLAPLGGRPYVVLHPGAAVPARRWPAEHHRATAGLLAADGLAVVVTGGPDEEALTAHGGGPRRPGDAAVTRRVLVARLDGAGDVLLAGPAVRAVAASGAEVTL
ncbi:MAG TPA: glycosyltransferase family 9 protein, partial [Pseudonocardia sp.]